MKNDINIDGVKYFVFNISGDLSHTYGNIMALVFQHIKDKFPPNFFKSEHVSKRIAIKQYQNINNILDLKKQKPIISILPKLNVDRVEYCFDYITRTFQTEMFRIISPEYPNDGFFKDIERNIFMYHSIERTSFDYAITIALPTDYQQYNLFTYMRNRIRFEHPYYLPLYMEVLLPESLVNQLSKDSGIPIVDENGSITTFLDYLNSISCIPIVYKFETGTSKKRFFLIMKNKPLIGFSDLDMDDGSKDGQIPDIYEITFRVRAEFNYPSCFYYINKSGDNTKLINNDDTNSFVPDVEYSYTYSYNMVTILDKLDNDNQLLINADFKFSEKDDNKGTVPFKQILRPLNIDILEYLKYNGGQYLTIMIYENGELVNNDRINISWKQFEINIEKIDIDKEYKLLIYENLKINNDYIIRHHRYN